MQMATIDVAPSVARQAVADYRRAVRERHSAEDALILKCYRELCRGHKVIDLVETLRSGDIDGLARPRLAVIRADARWCFYHHLGGDQQSAFSMEERLSYRRSRRVVRFPRIWGVGPRGTTRALVPTIPPALRPRCPNRYHILWEAEWDTVPVDPALLKHLGGPFYAVLATWDLTSVERAVLGLRR